MWPAKLFQFKTDEGGDCWPESVTYSLMCQECGEDICKYFGESGRNRFSRGEEHLANLEAEDENKSILKLHSIYHHNGRAVNESDRCSLKLPGQTGDGKSQY